MADRERKRAARQKRKARSADRAAGGEPADAAGAEDAPSEPGQTRAERKQAQAERRARMRERTEAKNEAVRSELEPLERGERPAIVTIAAVLSTLIWLASLVGYLLWDTLREEERPALIGTLSFLIVVGAMAYGLWRARYWAVLGFQALLGIVILLSGINLVAAVTVPLAVAAFVLMVGSGLLFFFMIRAMARIQMPERRLPD